MSKEEFKAWLRKCGFVIKTNGVGTQAIYLNEELVNAIAEKAKELQT